MKKLLIGLLTLTSFSAFASQNPNVGTYKIANKSTGQTLIFGKLTSDVVNRKVSLTFIKEDSYLSCGGSHSYSRRNNQPKKMTVYFFCTDGSDGQFQIQDYAQFKQLEKGISSQLEGAIIFSPIDYNRNYPLETLEITKQ